MAALIAESTTKALLAPADTPPGILKWAQAHLGPSFATVNYPSPRAATALAAAQQAVRASSLEVLCVAVEAPADADAALLGAALQRLRPGGKLVLRAGAAAPPAPTAVDIEDVPPPAVVPPEAEAAAGALRGALVLSGFVEASVAPPAALGANTVLYATAARPRWEVGASATLTLGGGGGGAAAAKPAGSKSVWQLTADDDGDLADDDLIDDDELLDGAAPLADAPEVDESKMDCGTAKGGKRRACKNCSCGLKEMLEEGEEPPTKTEEQASACGNCSKGDAFRCASCPYLGQPAFKPGERPAIKTAAAADGKGEVVELDLGGDDDVEF